jgi:hypothetical protein
MEIENTVQESSETFEMVKEAAVRGAVTAVAGVVAQQLAVLMTKKIASAYKNRKNRISDTES